MSCRARVTTPTHPSNPPLPAPPVCDIDSEYSSPSNSSLSNERGLLDTVCVFRCATAGWSTINVCENDDVLQAGWAGLGLLLKKRGKAWSAAAWPSVCESRFRIQTLWGGRQVVLFLPQRANTKHRICETMGWLFFHFKSAAFVIYT